MVHLVNPSHLSFGVGVITPRWLFVLAGATPASYGVPNVVDETLEPFAIERVQPGDVVGVGIHTGNALRGYEIGTAARARGAIVVFGGIHATLYPEEAQRLGGAHAVVRGDGDVVWPVVLADAGNGTLQPVYEAGRVEAERFVPARWELLPEGRYMWGSVQTVRGCPKHCSFCSVWRTDGQKPRQRHVDVVVDEIVELRRRGYRFIALADDNFYPVTLGDLAMAERQRNTARLEQLHALRAERFELMDRLSQLPRDMVFFTQITMEAAEDAAFLDAMRRANIKGALVGVEAVTPEGLKDVYKSFNDVGEALVSRLRTFRQHDVHVLGSFIFGLPSDRSSTFATTADIADRADLTFAQFVMLTPYPGTVDFAAWEKTLGENAPRVGDIPITRHWLIPQAERPKVYASHPVMAADEIRSRTQAVWDHFYSLPRIWRRSRCVETLRARLAFVLISKLYRQMYANTGIATDSARVNRANRWARLIAKPCRRLFIARPLPALVAPAGRASANGGRSATMLPLTAIHSGIGGPPISSSETVSSRATTS
jgi:tRNA A37 methylthiotransferase MiaB